MKFSDFQTATGTFKKVETDGHGEVSVLDSLAVDVDPSFGYTRIHTEHGEQIEGRKTIISTDPGSNLQDFWDKTHRNWILTYNGKDWQVEQPNPSYKIGTNTLEHIVLVVR